MRPLDITLLEIAEIRSDPEVMRYIVLYDRVLRAEKVIDPDEWTPEQRAAYRCEDFRVFSRLREYSNNEIDEFANFLDLSTALMAKYGDDDVAWIGYTIQEQTGVLGMTPKQMLDR